MSPAAPVHLLFSEPQRRSIKILERVIASFSICGSIFIIVVLLACARMRKPINRVIGYASVGNIFAGVASLISLSGVERGNGSSLCTFQGFLIQDFMAADALWTLAMAMNVYLTFFRGFNAARIRYMERWYILLCYGIPLIPALIYLFIDASHKYPPIYGNAAIWCWVSLDYDWMRLTFFYVPCWLAVITTFVIYILAGRTIYTKRRELRAMESQDQKHTRHSHMPRRAAPRPRALEGVVTMTTEVRIESTVVPSHLSDDEDLAFARQEARKYAHYSSRGASDYASNTLELSEKVRSPPGSPRPNSRGGSIPSTPMPLRSGSLTRPSNRMAQTTAPPFPGMTTKISSASHSRNASFDAPIIQKSSTPLPPPTVIVDEIEPLPTPNSALDEERSLHGLPESVRDGSQEDILGEITKDGSLVAHDDSTSLSARDSFSPMGYASRPSLADGSDARPETRRRRVAIQARSAALRYAKVAAMYFAAQLIVWIPSTINRIYTLALPHNPPIFALNAVAAAVLSTQGIWNAAIFTVANWIDLKRIWEDDIPKPKFMQRWTAL